MTLTNEKNAALDEPSYGVVVPVRVYLDDLDGFGMLNHVEYARLFDHAVIDFWTDAGWVLDPTRSVQAIREVHLTFHQPITATGDVAVHLWVDEAGRTSVNYRFRILSTDHTTLHAEGSRRLVNLDPATLRPTPLTDEQWTYAAPLLADHVKRPTA
ncbi:acyl-CoA thioesterase [Mumia quercus]|uniref:acyl-CoA thioesterase n=1 Tax=Mumia quercus TaxID=2976125 RepID=UPI0021D30B77|nr:thioesterase family protein [Mumia quercus]